MELDKLIIGNWYSIKYGGENIRAKCKDIVQYEGAYMSFYWGAPIRMSKFVSSDRILGECRDPRILSPIFRGIKNIWVWVFK